MLDAVSCAYAHRHQAVQCDTCSDRYQRSRHQPARLRALEFVREFPPGFLWGVAGILVFFLNAVFNFKAL